MRKKRILVDLFYCVRYVPGLRVSDVKNKLYPPLQKAGTRENRGALGFVIEARKEREGEG